MKVNWKPSENQSPVLYRHRAEWAGFKIHHLRVAAGEIDEQCFPFHDIKMALAGTVVTRTRMAGGSWKTNYEQPGKICLTPVGRLIKASWETEIEFLSITFNPAFFAQIASEQNFTGSIELIETHEQPDPLIQHIGLALLAEGATQSPIGQMYAESLAQTLILHLLKNYSTANQPRKIINGGLSGYKLRRAKEFINEHLEKDLSLAEVADTIGFSQSHFTRAFHRSTGLTPQQYLVQQRINRAKELLAKSDLPLIEVAICAGFKNQSHFSTLFRKFTALTPKAFREAKRR